MDREKLKKISKLVGLVATISSIVGFAAAFYKISIDTKYLCPPSGPVAQMCMDKYFSPEGPGHFVGQLMLPLTLAFVVGVLCLVLWMALWLIDRRSNHVISQQSGTFQFTGLQTEAHSSTIPVTNAQEVVRQPVSSFFCPECGFKNDPGQNFCNQCGSALK